MSTDTTELAKRAIIGELEQLRDQVRTLAEPLSEAEFWARPLEPGNSVGHLVLHLTGNLSHFALHRGQMSYIVRLVQKK